MKPNEYKYYDVFFTLKKHKHAKIEHTLGMFRHTQFLPKPNQTFHTKAYDNKKKKKKKKKRERKREKIERWPPLGILSNATIHLHPSSFMIFLRTIFISGFYFERSFIWRASLC